MPPKTRPLAEPHPIDAHVGRVISETRQGLGLSQTEVAVAIGVTFQQVQKYERGQNRVSASRLFQIAGVLSRPVSAFFPDGDERPSDAPLPTRQSAEIGQLASRLSVTDQKTVLSLMRILADREG